ncbi:PDE2 [Candida margitis]|uniref:PDE2 n=1 Tax=Candida margitis TaxID=1775924 RepID=UPI00222690E0|nr:PDE2 [Candida margitis]KAI5969856.1 PDE2 [Candida margitis]
MLEILSLYKDIPTFKVKSKYRTHEQQQQPQQSQYFPNFKLLVEYLFRKGSQEADINHPILVILPSEKEDKHHHHHRHHHPHHKHHQHRHSNRHPQQHQSDKAHASLASLSFKDRVILLDYFFGHLNIVIIPHDHDNLPSLQHQLSSIVDKLYHRISRIGIWSGTTMVQNAFDTKHRIPTMAELLYKNITRSRHATQHLYKLKQLVLSEIDFFNLLSNTSPAHLSYLCSTVGNWAFPAHELSNDDLVYCVYVMINYALQQIAHYQEEADASFVKDLHIPDRNELLAFIFIVRDTYRSGNPFHNFRHAVDVLQACFHFLVRLGCLPQFKQFIVDPYQVDKLEWTKNEEYVELIATSRVFSSVDLTQVLSKAVGRSSSSVGDKSNSISSMSSSSLSKLDSPADSEVSTASTVKQPRKPNLNLVQTLGLLVAALGHDVGHPGTTNAFMIKNRTPTSLVYNDRSVLESYHASIFINKVLNVCWPSLLQTKIDEDSLLNLHDLIVSSILATDMGEHFEYMSKLKNFSDRTNANDDASDAASEAQESMSNDNKIKLISALLIKCADISNVTRPLRVSSQWAVVLQREFDEVNQLDKLLNKQQEEEEEQQQPGQQELTADDDDDDEDTDTTTRSSISSSRTSFSDDAQGAEWFYELEQQQEIEYENLPFELNEILHNKPNIPSGQLFFIGTFAENLFNNISQVYPSLSYTCQIINDNKSYWLERKGESK